MRVCACTIAARPMLPSARVAARSFAEQHPELDVYTLLADTPGPGPDDQDPPTRLLGLDDLGRPDLLTRAFRASQQELSYALTPALLLHLLERGYDAVLFYKQESLVVGRQDAAIEQLRHCDVLLTPHLLEPLGGDDAADRERTILLSGVYNVGFLGVTDRPAARRLLEWWDARLATHCRHAVEDGLHFEQRWMDFAPSLVPGLGVLRDPAYNIGHWNITERAVTSAPDGTDVRVRGRPAALVRFSGYDPARPDRLTRHGDRVRLPALGTAAAVVHRYRRELVSAGWDESRTGDYGFSRFADGVPIPPSARALHRELEPSQAAAFGDPFAVGEGSFRAWACAPVDEHRPGVSRLMLAVRAARPDLVAAMPDPLGADRQAFCGWWGTHATEHAVSPRLAPPLPAGRGPGVVTVVDAARIAQARVLAASLAAHHPELRLQVLPLGPAPSGADEPFTLLQVDGHATGGVDALLARGLRADAAALAKTVALRHVLLEGHGCAIHLDADTEVVGDLAPLLDAAAANDITLVPHTLEPRFDPVELGAELVLLRAGTFNAGVVAVRGGPVGLEFLEWWARRIAGGAGQTPADGVFHDQRWLDLVPGLFEDVGVVRDPGIDVGPWNLHERLDVEWRLVHHSGFDPTRPDVPSPHFPALTFRTADRARAQYARYAEALLAAGWPRGAAPGDGPGLPAEAEALLATAPAGAIDTADPYGTGPRSLRAWLARPADDRQPPLTNLWLGYHRLRPDLQAAYPDPLGDDREAFVAWCAGTGRREHPTAPA